MTHSGDRRIGWWMVVLSLGVSAITHWLCAGEQSTAAHRVAPDQIAVTIDVKDVDVREVLRALARQADLNLTITEAVKGRVTLRLQDVPWDKALDAVVQTARLVSKRQADLITIMTPSEAGPPVKPAPGATGIETRVFTFDSAKAKAVQEAFKPRLTPNGNVILDEKSNSLIVSDLAENLEKLAALAASINAVPREPTQGAAKIAARTFSFEFARAQAAQEAFKAQLTPDGNVTLDEKSNSLIVSDVPDNLEKLAAMAVHIDAAPCQFVIDVFMTETVARDQKDVGVNWRVARTTSSSAIALAQDLISATGGGGTATYKLLGGTWTTDNLIRALEEVENLRILASPRILVLSGKEATIETVEQLPYRQLTETSGGGQIGTVAFKDVGVKLRVTPGMTTDGRIILRISAEQSAATGESIDDIPVVSTRKADSTLVLDDGAAVILGGLRRKERTVKIRQVPILGSIPGLGFFFRYTATTVENRDLLIFLTPRIFTRSQLSKKEQDALRGAHQMAPQSQSESKEGPSGTARDTGKDKGDGTPPPPP